jgi:hypothetical protein
VGKVSWLVHCLVNFKRCFFVRSDVFIMAGNVIRIYKSCCLIPAEMEIHPVFRKEKNNNK